MTNRRCGEYVRNYREGKGIPLRQKVLTILLLWLTIGSTVWLVISPWWLRLILLRPRRVVVSRDLAVVKNSSIVGLLAGADAQAA